MADDTFELFDLAVEVEEIRGTCTCDHRVGDRFELRGGKLHVPNERGFCLYALQSAIPLLPAKQRPTHANDWMSTDARIICPDPLCGVVLRIDRVASRTLHHAEVSAVVRETAATGDEAGQRSTVAAPPDPGRPPGESEGARAPSM